MSTVPLEFKGIVHGKIIELEQESGLPDGQEVKVKVEANEAAGAKSKLPPGEGIRRSAGAWADGGEELDRWLEEVYRSRRQDKRSGRDL